MNQKHTRTSQASPRPSVVVLTPVRNEAWILPRFLSTTSHWADKIIVADQGSSDESREICSRYEKVTLVVNRDSKYDEASRIALLLDKARELVPEPRLLFALHADEILAANAIHTAEWIALLRSAPGTLFRFENVDLYPQSSRCIRTFHNPFPLAYMDDNRKHEGKLIHSLRLPSPPPEHQVSFDQIKGLHYGYTRPRASRAKWRHYSVVENLSGLSSRGQRLWVYGKGREQFDLSKTEETPREWLEGWERLGIDMRSVDDSRTAWQDFAILKQFGIHGTRRFWLEDVWDNDWEDLRRTGIKQGIAGLPTSVVVSPPKWMSVVRALIKTQFLLHRRLRKLVQRSRTRFSSLRRSA